MRYNHYVDLFAPEIDKPIITNGDEVRRFALLTGLVVIGMADGFDECGDPACRCHETGLGELVEDLIHDLRLAADTHKAKARGSDQAEAHEGLARMEEALAHFLEGLHAAHKEGVLEHAFRASL